LQKWQISHGLYFPSNEDDLSAFYIAVTVTQQKNKGKGGSQHWTASYNYQSSSSLFFLPPAFTSWQQALPQVLVPWNVFLEIDQSTQLL